MACVAESREGASALPPGVPLALTEDPILVVGERPDEEAHELFRVVTPFLWPDGGVGVPMASDGTIRIFDANGDLRLSVGSEGEGPGEFRLLWSAWLRGDTIEAHDADLGRISRFGPDSLQRIITLERTPGAQVAAPGLGDGTWVLHGVAEVLPTGRDVIEVHRFAADGRHLEELARTLGYRRHTHEGGAGPDPLSPRHIVRTNGRRVYVGETLTARVTEIDVATGARRTIEWTPRDPLPTNEAIRVIRERAETVPMTEDARVRVEASLDALDGSEQVSVFWDLMVDGDDFLWIREYDPSLDAVPFESLVSTHGGGSWIVLDGQGARVSALAIPEDFEPKAIEADRVVGIRRDAFGVESVRVYGIVRSPR